MDELKTTLEDSLIQCIDMIVLEDYSQIPELRKKIVHAFVLLDSIGNKNEEDPSEILFDSQGHYKV